MPFVPETLVELVSIPWIRVGEVITSVFLSEGRLEVLFIQGVVMKICRADVVKYLGQQLLLPLRPVLGGRRKFPSIPRDIVRHQLIQIGIHLLISRNTVVVKSRTVRLLPSEDVIIAIFRRSSAYRSTVVDQSIERRQLLHVFRLVLRCPLCIGNRPDRYPRKVEHVHLGSAAVDRDKKLRALQILAEFLSRNRGSICIGILMLFPIRPHDHVVDRREEWLCIGQQPVLLLWITRIDQSRSRLGAPTDDPGDNVIEHFHRVPVVDNIDNSR